MSIQACAELVAKGDPDRFRAAMAAPVAARRVLFPLYAFALEVARAPWVTQEAMIAEMRLQWWRDVLTEIAEGGPVRRHEVATPLGDVLDPEGARALDRAVEARRWDIYRDPFADEAAFLSYLEDTGSALTETACRLLGASTATTTHIRAWSRATALARYLIAIPALEAAGRRALVDGRPATVADLACQGMAWRDGARSQLRRLPAVARAPLIEGWRTGPILRQAHATPTRVADGQLGIGPVHDRWRLIRAAWQLI